VAAVARASGVSRSTVRRLWERHGLIDAFAQRGTKAPRDPEIGPGSIIAIYIDPPWRVLARAVPTKRLRAVRPATGRSGRPSAASALLTALEAFGGETWTRRVPDRAGSAHMNEVLASLTRLGTKIAGGAALEVLAGPGPGSARHASLADAQNGADARIHLICARTRGAWLARATDWLLAASGGQDAALAGVFGHLMDYFAGWRDGNEPFIWTPSGPMQLPLKTA
jgi:hypothetical protein